jgi:hypothetical protein
MNDKQPEALRLAEQLEFLTKTNGGMVSVFISCGKLRQAAAELRRLHAANAELLAELQNIANANPRKWDEEVRDQFQQWAQNRARAAIAKATGEQQ